MYSYRCRKINQDVNIPVEEGTKPHCIPGLNDQYDEEELAKKIKKEWTTKEEKNQDSVIVKSK